MKSEASSGGGLRFQVDETPPAGLTLGLGLQLAVISVTAMNSDAWGRHRAIPQGLRVAS